MDYDQKTCQIFTSRLILRRFLETDAKEIERLINDDAVCRNTHAFNYPLEENWGETWIRKQKDSFEQEKTYIFAVTDRLSKKLYGFICLVYEAQDQRGEIGYAYGKEYWGNGFATEAANAVIEFGFQVKNMHKIFARHFLSNPASGQVMKKCGMVLEGIQLSHDFKTDHFEDVASYGIVNPRHI